MIPVWRKWDSISEQQPQANLELTLVLHSGCYFAEPTDREVRIRWAEVVGYS
jgi:hypothetical protein